MLAFHLTAPYSFSYIQVLVRLIFFLKPKVHAVYEQEQAALKLSLEKKAKFPKMAVNGR